MAQLILQRRRYLLALPVGLTIAGSIWDQVFIIPLVVISIFMVTALIPGFRKRENLGISILTAVCGVPFNIRASGYCVREVFLLSTVGEWLYFIIFFLFLLSLEEIIFGIIARLIWPRQYRFSFNTGKR